MELWYKKVKIQTKNLGKIHIFLIHTTGIPICYLVNHSQI